MNHILITLLSLAVFSNAEPLVYEGSDGPGKGKHIVFIAGDHEYRSEKSTNDGIPDAWYLGYALLSYAGAEWTSFSERVVVEKPTSPCRLATV